MKPNTLRQKLRIIELSKSNRPLPKLKYEYVTESHYQLEISPSKDTWTATLTLKPLPKPLKKQFEEELFQDYVEEPRVFAALLNGEQVGWIELGYHKWNNRTRVWEFLVKERFRGKGIGTQLLNQAVGIAREKRARMLILETQSCNVQAIRFYLARGFQLIGFDTTAYSNEDVERGEVRLEFGLRI